MQHGQQNPSFVDGVTPIFKTPYGVFCFLKGGRDKVCSLRSYAVLTKTPLKGCNVLRIEFNIMAAIFLAIPPFAHIFASIAPTCLGQNKVRIEVDK